MEVPNYMGFGGDAVVKLPRYVAFKDDDKYLAAYLQDGINYLQFNQDDIGSPWTTHEVTEVRPGSGIVRINCLYWNKFWRLSPNWIWADSSSFDITNNDMLFLPVKVGDNKLALRNLGNNQFCKALSTDNKIRCLNAASTTLERYAILTLEEPVLSRRVHSIAYRMDTARIYDLQPGTLFRTTVKNPSTQEATLDVGYEYTQKKSTNWKCGVSFRTGVKTTFEAGVPFVANAEVEVSAEIEVSGEWGGENGEETAVSGIYHAPVKGGETVVVTVTGSHAKCDVGFSYVQEDVLLTTGEKLKIQKHDGVFTGMNTTDVQFHIRYT